MRAEVWSTLCYSFLWRINGVGAPALPWNTCLWRALLCPRFTALQQEVSLSTEIQHLSDLVLPITNNKPRGLSVNTAPPKTRGRQTNRLWSELRSAWPTIRGQTVTRSPPLIMLFLKLSSSSRGSSVLSAARGLSLNISPLSSFSVSHTQTAKDRNGKEMVGEKNKRD